MAWYVTAIVASTAVGAVINSNASKDAAQTQADAANNATNVSNQQYEQTRADQAPYRAAGADALTQIQGGNFNHAFSMQDFQQDPGYQFSLQQGQDAIQRSAAARGLSTGTLKSLDSYSQGVANQGYNDAFNRYQSDTTNRYNRLASVAGLGQTANGVTAQAGSVAATNASNNIMAAGNANSAAQIGQANAITGALGTGINTWMQSQYMNKLLPQTTTTASGLSGQNAVSGGGGSYGLGLDYSQLGN